MGSLDHFSCPLCLPHSWGGMKRREGLEKIKDEEGGRASERYVTEPYGSMTLVSDVWKKADQWEAGSYGWQRRLCLTVHPLCGLLHGHCAYILPPPPLPLCCWYVCEWKLFFYWSNSSSFKAQFRRQFPSETEPRIFFSFSSLKGHFSDVSQVNKITKMSRYMWALPQTVNNRTGFDTFSCFLSFVCIISHSSHITRAQINKATNVHIRRQGRGGLEHRVDGVPPCRALCRGHNGVCGSLGYMHPVKPPPLLPRCFSANCWKLERHELNMRRIIGVIQTPFGDSRADLWPGVIIHTNRLDFFF